MNQIAKRIEATVKVGDLPASIRDQLGLPADESVRVTVEADAGTSRRAAFDDLSRSMDEMSAQAAANGLTPETLNQILAEPDAKDAFDIFGSDMPDEVFSGVFDQSREQRWRKIEL